MNINLLRQIDFTQFLNVLTAIAGCEIAIGCYDKNACLCLTHGNPPTEGLPEFLPTDISTSNESSLLHWSVYTCKLPLMLNDENCLIAVFTKHKLSNTSIIHVVMDMICNLISREYRQLVELHFMVRELTLRYEEINLLYALSDQLKIDSQEKESYQQALNVFVEYIDVDAAVYASMSQENLIVCARNNCSSYQDIINLIIIHLNKLLGSSNSCVINSNENLQTGQFGLSFPHKLLITTVKYRGDLEGILVMLKSMDKPDFTTGDRKLNEVMANQFSVIIKNNDMLKKSRVLSRVVEQTPDIVLITNQYGQTEYVNPSFETTTGFRLAEIAGKSPNIIYSGEKPKNFSTAMLDILNHGGSVQDTFSNKKKNGDTFYLEQTIASLRDADGVITHYVATGRDITEQRQKEHEAQKLLKAKLEAESLNHVKSAFFASMSHELRTPLTGILGFCELISDDMSDQGCAQHLPDLDKIKIAGYHLLFLINNLLDISKIEAGKMPVYNEYFNLKPLIQDVVSIVEPMTLANNNTIFEIFENDMNNLFMDKTKLKQILINLLSNANKFTHNGKITIHSKMDTTDNTKNLVLQITDTGIGMTPDQQQHVFNDYFQVGANQTHCGTGLGLSVCRQYCGLMRGAISVESTLQQGSIFTVTIPAKAEHNLQISAVNGK